MANQWPILIKALNQEVKERFCTQRWCFELLSAEGSLPIVPGRWNLVSEICCSVLREKPQMMVLAILLIQSAKLKNFSYPVPHFQVQMPPSRKGDD